MSKLIIHDIKSIETGEESYVIYTGDIAIQQRKYCHYGADNPMSVHEEIIVALCDHITGKK